MSQKKKYQQSSDCPISATIDVIGGKWKPIVIWVLMDGPMRFGEVHKNIPAMALKVLSRTLKELENDDIVSRKAYPEVPPRVEYSLTAKGKSLSGIMHSLAKWSEKNIMEIA